MIAHVLSGSRFVLWSLYCFSLLACSQPAAVSNTLPSASPAPKKASAQLWKAGNELFHQNPQWAGADSAYSIDLKDGRVLWLFGDTFIDPAGDGFRTNGPNFFIRNSIAIQSAPDKAHAYDASRAQMRFFWGDMHQPTPRSFFHDVEDAKHWTWPLAGVRLPQGQLLLFRMRLCKTESGLGFAIQGWDAVAIDDPSRDPNAWQARTVQPLTSSLNLIVGASAMIFADHLYAYAVRNDDSNHAVYLARWPLSAVQGEASGTLADPQWYVGDESFIAQSQSPSPKILFADGQTEFSVHYDTERGRFIQVQMRGLLLTDPSTALCYRTAPTPQGPWSPLVPVFRPTQLALPHKSSLIAYAGKAHPEQHGPELVTSLVVHDMQSEIPADALYYPQLIRLTLP